MSRIPLLVMMSAVLILPSAQAIQYADDGIHYRITVPDGWALRSCSGLCDAAFLGPADPVFTPMLFVYTLASLNASNTDAYLLGQAGDVYGTFFTNTSSSVQPPRLFPGTGRMAAELALDSDAPDGTRIRLRVAIFASGVHHRWWSLRMESLPSDLPAMNAWAPTVSAFEVTGEEGLPLWVLGGVFGAVALALVASFFRIARRGKRRSRMHTYGGSTIGYRAKAPRSRR